MKINNNFFNLIAGIIILTPLISVSQKDQPVLAQASSTAPLSKKTMNIGRTHQKALLINLKEKLQNAKNNNDKKGAIDDALKLATSKTENYLIQARNDLNNATSYIDAALDAQNK